MFELLFKDKIMLTRRFCYFGFRLAKTVPGLSLVFTMATRPNSDMAAFRKHLSNVKHVLVLTGAGISAESGIPTFRGAGGYWRTYVSQELATPGAFHQNPSLVWEFYHHRREVVLTKDPNNGHKAIAEYEKRMKAEGKEFVVVTQNIDELHRRAGTENIIELHGSLFKTMCTKCHEIVKNYDSPICAALKNRGAPDPEAKSDPIPLDQLPSCKSCGGLLRPKVTWFGEALDHDVMQAAGHHLENCDLCLVIGTSSVVYPAAMFAPQVASRGVPVAEFNLEETSATSSFGFHFSGPASETVPVALAE